MPIYKIKDKTILFIHIPKSGGTSLKTWLSAHGEQSLYLKHRKDMLPLVPQHFHREYLDALFAPGFFDYSFCITRNPYSRILSEYNYRITRPTLRNKALPSPSFDRWLKSSLRKYQSDPFLFSNHLRPQHEFPIEGTDVFRLEDGLDAVRHRLGDLTGIQSDETIPRKNISKKSANSLTEAQADRIYDFYQEDFKRFGYDRDSWKDV